MRCSNLRTGERSYEGIDLVIGLGIAMALWFLAILIGYCVNSGRTADLSAHPTVELLAATPRIPGRERFVDVYTRGLELELMSSTL